MFGEEEGKLQDKVEEKVVFYVFMDMAIRKKLLVKILISHRSGQ